MTQNLEDIENILSQHNIIINKDLHEIRVVKKRKLNNGYHETVNVDKIKLPREIINNYNSNPQNKVLNTICLRIEDINRAVSLESHWKIFNVSFRKVLLYGLAVVENKFNKNGDSMYTISLDDETGMILGTYKEFEKKEVTKQKAMLTREVNQFKRRKEVGVNMFGAFFPTASDNGQYVLNCVGNLQKMIAKNFERLHKKFQQGPIKEKVLVYAKPFHFHGTTRLYIIDLWECNQIELAWKRHLNRLYLNQYLKC